MAKPPPTPRIDPAIATQLLIALTKILDTAFDWKIVGLLCSTFLGFVAMLPPADRANVKITDFLAVLGGDSFWMGVSILLALALLVSAGIAGLAIYLQNRRLNELGQQLAALRDAEDPERLSSRDTKKLAEYTSRAQARHKQPTKR
jgi:hypothetical protein